MTTRKCKATRALSTALILGLCVLASGSARALIYQVTSPDGIDALANSFPKAEVVVHLEEGAVVELVADDSWKRGSYFRIILPDSKTTAWVHKSKGKLNLYRQSHALLIAINDYPGGQANDLKTPVADIQKLRSTLIELGFHAKNIKVLDTPNQTKRAAILNTLREMWKLSEHDRVFIAYSGHGESEPGMGYIVPSDASPGSDFANYIPMVEFRRYYEQIPAKHMFLVFDSCFSGSVYESKAGTSLRPVRFGSDIPKWLRNMTSLKARQAITAGTAEQTVPDDGLFMERFIEALTKPIDVDAPGYVTARDVMNFMAKQSLPGLTPTPGDLFGHKRGDFIFKGNPYTESIESQKESKKISPKITAVSKILEGLRNTGRLSEHEAVLKSLRMQMSWTIEWKKTQYSGRMLRIRYEKLLPGEPHPVMINLTLESIPISKYYRSDGFIGGYMQETKIRLTARSQKSGFFEIMIPQGFSEVLETDRVGRLRAKIIPIFEDEFLQLSPIYLVMEYAMLR